MKRDMDLIRDLLRSLEENESCWANTTDLIKRFVDENRSHEFVKYHLYLLSDADLAQPHPSTTAYRLGWLGHEFLDATREPERWERTKEIAQQAGGVPFQIMVDFAKRLAWEAVTRLAGLKE